MNNFDNIIPVILCGGSGTRLWPASREDYPKQFLSLMEDRSLLQKTADRALSITGGDASSVVTVTLGAMSGLIKEHLGTHNADKHIISEPSARNTAAAIALAALHVRAEFDDDAMLWILAADHHIENEDALKKALVQAIPAAEHGHLMTFGIEPTRPETGYGYIKTGMESDYVHVYKVQSFVEKPDLHTAQAYLKDGGYVWNSGMFLFKASSVLQEFRTHAPDILDQVIKAMDAGEAGAPDANLYDKIDKAPFDKAIMEKSDKVAVVPCDPQWSDIGSWESLWEIRKQDSDGNILDGDVVVHDAANNLIQGHDRLIAVAGLDNLVVVDVGDAILIADKRNGDAIKALVTKIKEDDRVEARVRPPNKT